MFSKYIVILFKLTFLFLLLFFSCQKKNSVSVNEQQKDKAFSTPPAPVLLPLKNEPFWELFKPQKAPAMLINNNLPPKAEGHKIHIELHPLKPLTKISPMLYGNNAGIWLGNDYLFNDKLKERLNTISLPLLRWPGGSDSDRYHFDGNYPPYIKKQNIPHLLPNWEPTTAQFLSFTKKIGAEPLLVVNHGYSTYYKNKTDENLQRAVDLAVSWVKYCNAPNDGTGVYQGIDWAAKRTQDGFYDPFNIKFFEIGNEVFGSWETGHTDGASYAKAFIAFYDAMKQADPDIYIGAPATVNFHRSSYIKWMKDFLSYPGVAKRVDFLDIHEYFGYVRGTPKCTEAKDLMNNYNKISDDIDLLKAFVKKYTDKESIPIFFGEYHLTHPSNRTNITLASGLLTAGALGTFAEKEINAAAFWNIANDWSNEGDLGFLARNHPTAPDYSPYPAYYPFYMFTRNFGDTLITTILDNWDIKVFASTFEDGEIGLIVINPHAKPKSLTIKTPNPISGYLNMWILEGDSLCDTEFRWNDLKTIHKAGGVDIRDIDAYFLDVGETTEFTVPSPAHSVMNLVIY